MRLVFDFIQLAFSTRSATQLVQRAVAGVCLPRVPPHNWTPSGNAGADPSNIGETQCVPSGPCIVDQYDLRQSLSAGSNERVSVEDSPVLTEIPRATNDAPHRGDKDVTMIDSATILDNVDFSIYSDVSSPNLNRAVFITPVRPTLLPIVDADLNLLRAASERVSEILRENRRRLDTGEDTSVIRREARRKRAQELSSRNHGSSIF